MEPGWEKVKNTPELRNLLEQIFTDSFMQEHTRFPNFAGFCYSSAVIVDWKGENLVYPTLLMDHFVNEGTDFSSWEEMVCYAADCRFSLG